MRTKKETGYTLVNIVDGDLSAAFYASKDALEKAIGSESIGNAMLFAGPSLIFTATTQTIVTIGSPTTRKGKQQPVKAAELPKPRRKAAGPGLRADGSPRKPRTVKPKTDAAPANGEHKEAAKTDGAQS